MIEVLLCVVFLIVAGFLIVTPFDDYRVGVVGWLGLVSGFVVMVFRAVQGSRSFRARTGQDKGADDDVAGHGG